MLSTKLVWNGGKVIKAFNDANKKSLLEAGPLVTAQARSNAPVDFGNLKGSITWTIKGKPSVFQRVVGELGGRALGNGESIEPPEGEVWVGSIVVYAIYQELGTRTMQAQPYLIPALDSNRDRIIDLFRKNGIDIDEVQR